MIGSIEVTRPMKGWKLLIFGGLSSCYSGCGPMTTTPCPAARVMVEPLPTSSDGLGGAARCLVVAELGVLLAPHLWLPEELSQRIEWRHFIDVSAWKHESQLFWN